MSFKGTDMETNWKVFEDEFKDFVHSYWAK